MRYRLVQQVITEDNRFIAIMSGQPPPDSEQVLLFLWTLIQPGISDAVVDVRASLSAGRGMQIKDQIQTFGAAPGDQAIQQLKTFGVIGLEEVVMQRNANGIKSCAMQERDVLMRDVVVAVLLPECGGGFRPKKLQH